MKDFDLFTTGEEDWSDWESLASDNDWDEWALLLSSDDDM